MMPDLEDDSALYEEDEVVREEEEEEEEEDGGDGSEFLNDENITSCARVENCVVLSEFEQNLSKEQVGKPYINTVYTACPFFPLRYRRKIPELF